MAKPLGKRPPSSSITRLLETKVATAAITPPGAESVETLASSVPEAADLPHHPQAVVNEPTGEPANITRQFLLTQTADRTLKQAVDIYSKAIGADLSNSHFLRAVLKGVTHAMTELEREAAKLKPMKRPRNARGSEAAREEFERKITAAFIAGMRATATYE